MTTFTIKSGSKEVMIVKQGDNYSARLYVNNGETATLQSWKGKTEAGARKWASRMMAR
jgi:hypothetical protein